MNDRGTLFLRQCAVIGNRTLPAEFDAGGGIYSREGSVTIEQSTIAGNVAQNGGGICNVRTTPGTSVVTIRKSTISGNAANGGSGGGVYNEGLNSGSTADLSLTNSTLSGNSATPAGFFGGAGGAIYNFGNISGVVHASLQDCTISDNNAPSAGGIYNRQFSASAFLTLQNTILKTGAIGSNFINADGIITSLGHNLSSDDAVGLKRHRSRWILEWRRRHQKHRSAARAAPEQRRPHLHHALLNGSPAINAGVNSSETSLDQRGFPRVSANDIGAFEFGSVLPGPAVVSAVSRKLHGGTPFDIDLPVSWRGRQSNAGAEARAMIIKSS